MLLPLKVTHPQGDTEPNVDAGKQIQGRKQHILVDTLGLILVVVVTITGYSTSGALCKGSALSTQLISVMHRDKCVIIKHSNYAVKGKR